MSGLKSIFGLILLMLLLAGIASLSRSNKSNGNESLGIKKEEKVKEGEKVNPEKAETTGAPIGASRFVKPQTFENLKSIGEQTSSEDLLYVFLGTKTILKMKAKRILAVRANELPLLMEALNENNTEMKIWVLKTMQDMKNPAVLPSVLSLLESQKLQVVKEACRTIEILKGEQYYLSVLGLLKHKDFKVRIAALECLGGINAFKAIPQILALLEETTSEEDPQEILRGAMLVALAKIGDVSLLEEVRPYLFSRKPKAVTGALKILYHWEGPKINEALAEHYNKLQDMQALNILSRKKNAAPYFAKLLNEKSSLEAIKMGIRVFHKEKNDEAIELLKLLMVNRPELKQTIIATLLFLGVELPELQNSFGALKGQLGLFELYPDASERVVWRRVRPGRGFSIRIWNPKEKDKMLLEETDERGHFSFSRIKMGRYILEVDREGFELTQQKIGIASQLTKTKVELLKTNRQLGISFVVKDMDQRGLPGVKVVFDFKKHQLDKETDAYGKVVFDNLIRGKYLVAFKHPEYKTVLREFTFKEEMTISITLEKY